MPITYRTTTTTINYNKNNNIPLILKNTYFPSYLNPFYRRYSETLASNILHANSRIKNKKYSN